MGRGQVLTTNPGSKNSKADTWLINLEPLGPLFQPTQTGVEIGLP